MEGFCCPCITAVRVDLQQMESDRSFMPSASLMKISAAQLHPPLSMGCSTVFPHSSEHCLIAGYRGRVPSSCSHPSSCQHPRQSMGFARVSFLYPSLIFSPTIRFLSFSCLVFAKFGLIERRRIPSVGLSLFLHFCMGLATFVVTPLLFFASSLFIPPLVQNLRHSCAASDDPFLLILRSSSGLEGLHRARHGLGEEVVDCIGRLLGIHKASELRLVLLKRVLDNAFHFWLFVHPAVQHAYMASADHAGSSLAFSRLQHF